MCLYHLINDIYIYIYKRIITSTAESKCGGPRVFFPAITNCTQEMKTNVQCIDTTAAWKKLRFILSVRSDFHMIESLSIAVHAFVSRVSMSFSVDESYFLGR